MWSMGVSGFSSTILAAWSTTAFLVLSMSSGRSQACTQVGLGISSDHHTHAILTAASRRRPSCANTVALSIVVCGHSRTALPEDMHLQHRQGGLLLSEHLQVDVRQPYSSVLLVLTLLVPRPCHIRLPDTGQLVQGRCLQARGLHQTMQQRLHRQCPLTPHSLRSARAHACGTEKWPEMNQHRQGV